MSTARLTSSSKYPVSRAKSKVHWARRPVSLVEKIDKLTNSIEDAVTHNSFPTLVRPFQLMEAKQLVHADWLFNWAKQGAKRNQKLFQLNTLDNLSVIHGLISLEVQRPEKYVFMHLVESAKFNRGKQKQYLGVLGNLVAFACKMSFEADLDGFVVFDSKTDLVSHYKKELGARHITATRLYLGTLEAADLVKKYYPVYNS